MLKLVIILLFRQLLLTEEREGWFCLRGIQACSNGKTRFALA